MAKFEIFDLPDDLYYHAEDHLWAKVEGNQVRMGLDDVAQASAQKITSLRIKPPGKIAVAQNKPFGTMEAGKYVGPLRLLVAGRIIENNQDVMDDPSLANSDPYGKGWLVVVEAENLARDLPALVSGDKLQAWLESSVVDWRARGLLQ